MKKIKFGLAQGYQEKTGLTMDPPRSSSSFVPQWYKDGEMFVNKDLRLTIGKNDKPVASMKACNPFLDAISSGYMLTTWIDIEIIENSKSSFSWKYLQKDKNNNFVDAILDYDQMGVRAGEAGHTIPRPEGHEHHHLVWKGKWGFKTPRGWSSLVTHPMNQFQLPFTTTSGIVDSDRFPASGNIPFFIKKGWTGIIHKNTPIAQIVPIKRSSWLSVSTIIDDYSQKLGNDSREQSPGFYRSKLWVPKRYQ